MAKLSDARRSLERALNTALERMKQIEVEKRRIKWSVKSLKAAMKALATSEPLADQERPGAATNSVDSDSAVSFDQSNESNSMCSPKEGSDDAELSEQ